MKKSISKPNLLDEIQAFFDKLEKKYKVDIKYNVDKITKR